MKKIVDYLLVCNECTEDEILADDAETLKECVKLAEKHAKKHGCLNFSLRRCIGLDLKLNEGEKVDLKNWPETTDIPLNKLKCAGEANFGAFCEDCEGDKADVCDDIELPDLVNCLNEHSEKYGCKNFHIWKKVWIDITAKQNPTIKFDVWPEFKKQAKRGRD